MVKSQFLKFFYVENWRNWRLFSKTCHFSLFHGIYTLLPWSEALKWTSLSRMNVDTTRSTKQASRIGLRKSYDSDWFPLMSPWKRTDRQNDLFCFKAGNMARLDKGKRFKTTNITQTVPNVSSYVPWIPEKYWINHCKALFFMIKHLNVQT